MERVTVMTEAHRRHRRGPRAVWAEAPRGDLCWRARGKKSSTEQAHLCGGYAAIGSTRRSANERKADADMSPRPTKVDGVIR